MMRGVSLSTMGTCSSVGWPGAWLLICSVAVWLVVWSAGSSSPVRKEPTVSSSTSTPVLPCRVARLFPRADGPTNGRALADVLRSQVLDPFAARNFVEPGQKAGEGCAALTCCCWFCLPGRARPGLALPGLAWPCSALNATAATNSSIQNVLLATKPLARLSSTIGNQALSTILGTQSTIANRPRIHRVLQGGLRSACERRLRGAAPNSLAEVFLH